MIFNKCRLTSSLPTASQGFAGIPSDAAQGMTERMMSRAGDGHILKQPATAQTAWKPPVSAFDAQGFCILSSIG